MTSVPSTSLPPGWTEHKAPTGHKYYYNSATKKSTYTRPVAETPVQQQQWVPPPAPSPSASYQFSGAGETAFGTGAGSNAPAYYSPFGVVGLESAPPSLSSAAGNPRQEAPHGFAQTQRHRGRNDPRNDPRHAKDRPKTRHDIPGCKPWVLIKTRYGRRFVHNTETKESLWRFPKHVMAGVVEYDIQERKRAEGQQGATEAQRDSTIKANDGDGDDDQAAAEQEFMALEEESNEDMAAMESGPEAPAHSSKAMQPATVAPAGDDDESEYEEVEVTDDEDTEDDNGAEGHARKRQKIYSTGADGDAPVEFGEEDMAYQLAQMGEAYELDPGEYQGDEDDSELEDGAEGLPISEEEARAGFESLLADFEVDPYTTWDKVIENEGVVSDPRYTLLPNMKARRQAFADWSTREMERRAAIKASMAPVSSKAAYLSLLHTHATPKLYWPEFRRKFKKEAAMKDAQLSDRDREKLYREHINRVTKLSASQRTVDLRTLLETTPPSTTWNRSTGRDADPPMAVREDVRWISVDEKTRRNVQAEVVATLPSAISVTEIVALGGESGVNGQDEAQRHNALARRQRQVDEAKRQQQRELASGRARLELGASELEGALKIDRRSLAEQLT